MELFNNKDFKGFTFEILKEEKENSVYGFTVLMRATNHNNKKKKLKIKSHYISIESGLIEGNVRGLDIGSYGSFIQPEAFIDLGLYYYDNIRRACDGDRIELEINDGNIASLLLKRERGQWWIIEDKSRISINKDLKNRIEHFEYIDEKFGLTLQKFSVRIIDDNSLDLFCEVLATNGEVSEEGFNIEVAIYDINDNIVKLTSLSRYDNDFKGFEVFHFGPIKLDITVDEIGKIRFYPTR